MPQMFERLQVPSPQERPRKRKQVSLYQHPVQKSLEDIAKASRLDEELGKLRLLIDE